MQPLPGQLALFPDAPEESHTYTPAASAHDDRATAPYRGAFFRAFTADTAEAEAIDGFRRRYGRPPATVTRGLGGIVLAGPIPERSIRQ